MKKIIPHGTTMKQPFYLKINDGDIEKAAQHLLITLKSFYLSKMGRTYCNSKTQIYTLKKLVLSSVNQ